GGASSEARIDFFWEVIQVAPTPVRIDFVPIFATGNLQGNVGAVVFGTSGLAEIHASFGLNGGGIGVGVPIPTCVVDGENSDCVASFSAPFSRQGFAPPGIVLGGELDVTGFGGGEASSPDQLFSAGWDVVADPTVIVDPTFPFKDDFALVFSPNLFVAPTAVPEPSTYLLFGTGLVSLLGFARRGKKRHG